MKRRPPDKQKPLRPEGLLLLGLTRRQAEILGWLALGKTDAQIARILGISPRTVSHTLEKVYRRLGVQTRTAAVARVLRPGERD